MDLLQLQNLALKMLIAGVLWYMAHKFIRKWLNPSKYTSWDDDDELDARLGGLAAAAKAMVKFLFL